MARALVIACAFTVAATSVLSSQAPSLSPPVARQLAEAMTKQKLDAIAAVEPGQEGRFVAALFLPGQLLVIGARYPVQALIADQIARKAYHDVYSALHGTTLRETSFFVHDIGADGLDSAGSGDTVYDKVDTQIVLDGHPDRRKISRQVYEKQYQEADERYSRLLKLLLDEVHRSK